MEKKSLKIEPFAWFRVEFIGKNGFPPEKFSGSERMRSDYSAQYRLDCVPIEQLRLNLNCRDEIIPILEGLKHVFCQADLRKQHTQLVASDVNARTRDDVGREGLDYWQIVVLAVVRLGCNIDYDRLQDLCENHLALRCLLCVGEWDGTNFSARRIRDTLCLLNPATIEKMNQVVVSYGQQCDGHRRKRFEPTRSWSKPISTIPQRAAYLGRTTKAHSRLRDACSVAWYVGLATSRTFKEEGKTSDSERSPDSAAAETHVSKPR